MHDSCRLRSISRGGHWNDEICALCETIVQYSMVFAVHTEHIVLGDALVPTGVD